MVLTSIHLLNSFAGFVLIHGVLKRNMVKLLLNGPVFSEHKLTSREEWSFYKDGNKKKIEENCINFWSYTWSDLKKV